MQFQFEQLEERVLLAANIKSSGSNLVITGDSGDDLIAVVGTGAEGQVDVGIDSNNDGVIDANEYRSFSGVRKIKIVTKGGDDEIILDNINIAKNLKINTGNGDDIIYSSNVHVGGKAQLNGGKGFDSIVDLGGNSSGRGQVLKNFESNEVPDGPDDPPPGGGNGLPGANDDAFTTAEDTPLLVNPNVNLLNNDGPGAGPILSVNGLPLSDIDLDPSTPNTLTTTLESGAIITVNADGTFSYDPNGAFDSLPEGDEAEDQFEYQYLDGQGNTSTAVVRMTITGVDTGPQTAGDNPPALFENGTNFDGQLVVDPDSPVFITAVQAGDGAGNDTTVQIDPGGNYFFTTADGSIVTIYQNGRFTVNTNASNLAEGQTRAIPITVTTAGGTLTTSIILVGQNDGGPTAIDDGGQNDLRGPLTVNETDFNEVQLFVAPPFDAEPFSVLSNDTDPDNDTFSVSAVGGLATNIGVQVPGSNGGLFRINQDGTVMFAANGEFNLEVNQTATTSIEYTMTDGNGGFSTATLTVTIVGEEGDPIPNNPPIANDDTVFMNTIFEESNNAEVIESVLVNDLDIEGDDLAVASINGDSTLVGVPVFGTPENPGGPRGLFVVTEDGQVFFDPNNEFNHLAAGEILMTSVTYTVTDGEDESEPATITVMVTGQNDQPLANDDVAQPVAFNGGSVQLSFVQNGIAHDNVLYNDTDPDTSDIAQLQVVPQTNVRGSNGGLFSIDANGVVTFNANPAGTDDDVPNPGAGNFVFTTLDYTIEDPAGGQSTATIVVRVNGVDP